MLELVGPELELVEPGLSIEVGARPQQEELVGLVLSIDLMVVLAEPEQSILVEVLELVEPEQSIVVVELEPVELELVELEQSIVVEELGPVHRIAVEVLVPIVVEHIGCLVVAPELMELDWVASICCSNEKHRH